MTIKNSPIEASHIMMFARSIGDDNQIYYDAGLCEDDGAEGRSLRRRRSFNRARNSILTTSCGRKSGQAWFGSGKEPTGIKRDRRAVVAAAVVAVCTPNSTTNITAT